MYWRKGFLWATSLCVFVLFAGSVLPTVLGCFAKCYFRFEKGWDLTFSSVTWKDKGFVFSDLVLKDDACFSLSAPEASVCIHTKHVFIDRPVITISQIPMLGANSSSKWVGSLENGLLKWGDLPITSFSLKQEYGHAEIVLGNASVSIHKKGAVVDVVYDQFPLRVLNLLTGKQWEGRIQGSIQLDNGSLVKGSIEGKDVGLEGIAQEICGALSWEGPFDDWTQIFDQGRLRLSITQGSLVKPLIADLQGVCTFDGGSGVKWECSFLHLSQAMHSFGRGFLNSLQGRWVESEIRSGESSLFVHGHEKNEDLILDFTAQAMSSEIITTLLEITNLFGTTPVNWSMEEGIVSGSLQLLINQKTASIGWTVPHCSIRNICLRNESIKVSCDEATIVDGAYVFGAARFCINDQLLGENWSGVGNLTTGIGAISGNIGELSFSSDYEGNLDALSAYIQASGKFKGEGSLQCERLSEGMQFVLKGAKGTFLSEYKIEELQLQGIASLESISCYDVKGILDLGKKVPFYCPVIQSDGVFDLRFVHPLFDLARLTGTYQSGSIAVDQERSHFLNVPVSLGRGTVLKTGLETLFIQCDLPWKLISFFCELPLAYPQEKSIACQFSYDKEKGSEMKLATGLFYQGNEIPIDLQMNAVGPTWHVSSHVATSILEGDFQFDKDGLQISRGKINGGSVETDFSGRLTSYDQWELNLSQIRLDLAAIRPDIQGFLQGEGIIHWKGALEADFDLIASPIQFNDFLLENDGSLHVFCSSKMGVFVQGISLSLLDKHLGPTSANCKIGLFQCKNHPEESVFTLTQSQFNLPAEFLTKVGVHFAKDQSLQGIADLTFSSDFSHVSLTMKEAIIPYDDKKYCIRNLHVDVDYKDYKIDFGLEHNSRLIPIDIAFHLDPLVKGRLTIENGLKIDWTYQNKLTIQSLQGMCAGIETSFHLDGDSLIGSARLNGNELRTLLPDKIAQVFHELKIGDGYELMGRLSFPPKGGIGFQGILRGKQIELFGFELKNILAQIEWDTEHLAINNLKISDFAGVAKVEQILAQGIGDDPWTISIPHIVITELRPSLLQDVGKPPGKLNPLVVREIRIDDFQGLVDDSKTYTAKGELYFINSYKRESSILELPSDLLSRIVGLDLDLLVPVCGTLRYELHDGFFHFTELLDAYSENNRSQFFLVFNEDSPKMDLDWNVNIFIQTKQFVLFKFTEAFIISVSGKLDEPKFQLQRKKLFLGVL